MFTVIICSEKFYNQTKRNYSHVVEAVSKSDDCAFCIWDTDKALFEDALPDLESLLVGRSKWRAVVVHDSITFGIDAIDKRNPFDYVGAEKVLQAFNEKEILETLSDFEAFKKANKPVKQEDWDELDKKIAESESCIKAYRERKKSNYNAAVSKPLTRLGVWLYGIEGKYEPNISEEMPKELYDDAVAIDRKYYSALEEKKILASDIEQYHTLKYKYEILKDNFHMGAMVSKKPESILIISERVKARRDDAFYSPQGEYEELEYSNFCDDNLYSRKMRFIFFDIGMENHKKDPSDYLSFVSAMLVYATNELPELAVRAERVYKCNTVINKKKAVDFYSHYLSKLYKTRKILMRAMRARIDEMKKKDVTPEEALAAFEADSEIKVEIQSATKKEDLMSEYSKLGLAKDCPIEEYHYWYNQVQEITKRFIRYLREPRRALKKTVSGDFREQNTIENDRINNLNEYQLEDIQYRIDEEEEKMIKTTTESIFNTKKYNDMLDEADQEVRKAISQRMTRNKTLIAGLIACGTYFIGFLPLLFSTLNGVFSLSVSLMITGITVGLFALLGIVFLFVLRKRLIDRFKHFNYVMSGILSNIENGLAAFSRYLNHACNVMRGFSVFKKLEDKEDHRLNVIKKHINDIDVRINETEIMFTGDLDSIFVTDEEVKPYDYDFTIARDYTYEIPYYAEDTDVEFIVKGNVALSPVNYIESIKLTREELYD